MNQKCPISSAKKRHFERPNLRTDSKNLAKHRPKWWGRHLAHSFPFLGKSKPIFENCLFYVCQELFSHYHGRQTSSGLPSGIYGSINFKKKNLGSPNHPEHALRWTKKSSKKLFFWPRLIIIVIIIMLHRWTTPCSTSPTRQPWSLARLDSPFTRSR